MSLLDTVRETAESLRNAITDPEEREQLKDKAMDLPGYALQTALAGIGQALIFADRCRNTIMQLVGNEEEEKDKEPEEPVRRRPPVIYEATRPAPSNGQSAKPEPPIPDYEDLTVPSLRARLRGLTPEQVEGLRDYEKATLGRAEVIRMYENRLVKLANLPKPKD